MERYFGLSDLEDIKNQFELSDDYDLTGTEIIYAFYSYENYEGYAQVIFAQNGKLFEVNASHCSCNGLGNGSWGPVETSFKALMNLTTTNETAKSNLQQWANYHEFKVPEEPKKSCSMCQYNQDERVLEFDGRGKNKVLLCRNCHYFKHLKDKKN